MNTELFKMCSQCRQVLSYYSFGPDKRATTGLRSECKECHKLSSRKYRRDNPDKKHNQNIAYRQENLDRAKQWNLQWNATHAVEMRVVIRKWKKRNPDRVMLMNRASAAVSRALSTGVLARPDSCENCNKVCVPQAAHFNYVELLYVRWLCNSCHSQWDHDDPKTINRGTD